MFSRQSILASTLAAATLLSQLVQADVKFSSPAAGVTISGTTIDVEFTDGGDDPPLADFTTYTLQLCAGGNGATDFTPLLTFTDEGDFSSSTYSAKITNLAIGGDDKNAYFLRTIGVAPGGTVINYSDRFTLSGMTGTFSEAVQKALEDVSGTSGPATESNIGPNAAAQAADVPSVAGGGPEFQVPYTMQTGVVRFAPMAKKAPGKITYGGDARQHPTSAYTPWGRSGMPPPDATKTQTDLFTFAVVSMEPTMAPQSQADDMQKFLNRWKD